MSDARTDDVLGGFRWTETEWHRATIRAAAEMASLAYADDDVIQTAFPDWQLHSVHDKGVDIAVLHKDGRVLILCRGSEISWSDWARNFKFIPKKLDGMDGAAHGGYAQGAMDALPSIRDSLEDWLTDEPASLRAIRSIGHSQGGGIAQIIAELLHRRYNYPAHKIMAISFASPRVWARCTWLKRLTGWSIETAPLVRHIRVVTARDAVPETPSPLFFRHHGELHVLTDEPKHLVDVTPKQMMWIRIRSITRLVLKGVAAPVPWPLRVAMILGDLRRIGKSHGMSGKYSKILDELP